MAVTSGIEQAMNNITLEDEEEGGFKDINTKFCLVGRFLMEGVVDFPAIKQTMAALWRPGKGVYIKEIDINLYLF